MPQCGSCANQAPGSANTPGFVFTTSIGTPMDGPTVTHRFEALLKKVSLPNMRFYDLRHPCGTLLLAQGVHPRVVLEILGHSRISITMNLYSHVIPAMQQEVARGWMRSSRRRPPRKVLPPVCHQRARRTRSTSP